MGIWSSKVEAESSVDTVSLGMVVIDEIRLPSRPPLVDVAGGSGAYATLGSRLFVTRAHSKKIGCLVLAGYDFPEIVKKQLLTWQMTMRWNVLQDRLSTRGLLEYQDDTFGPKKFHYTTEPLRSSPTDLVGTSLLGSEAFHLLAAPEDVEKQIRKLLKLRKQYGFKKRPFIVWEPVPAACIPQNRHAFLQACQHVDVFSPNHLEMSALFEASPPEGFQPDRLEAYASEFCKATGPNSDGTVVVRSGEYGSLTTQAIAKHVWLPPYYQLEAAEVIDPTGGGNTYMGGFIIGWKVSKDIVEASVYGNVAASFAIEQIGLPSCQTRHGEEIWNGVGVMERLSEYKARLESRKPIDKPN